MITSYHCHTRWSDGEGEVSDFVQAARELGISEIGLSDHYVLTPDRSCKNWAMPLDALDDYVAEVQAAMQESERDPIVRLGVEADYIPETAEELRDILSRHAFDYVIGSVHSVDGFPIDGSASDWEPLSESDRDDLVRGYWVRVREMAASRIFDLAGHLDLTKKFGYRPMTDISPQVSSALDSVASSDMAVELNTSGWHVPAVEQYPSSAILAECFERGIPVVLTADAHTPGNVDRSFVRARSLLRESGYRELACFAARVRNSHVLEASESGWRR